MASFSLLIIDINSGLNFFFASIWAEDSPELLIKTEGILKPWGITDLVELECCLCSYSSGWFDLKTCGITDSELFYDNTPFTKS